MRTATKFRSKVTITKDGTTTDGKSILGILFLVAAVGSVITISATGEDEEAAVNALATLVVEGLGEKGSG